MEWSEVSKLFEGGENTPGWNSHPIDSQLDILKEFYPIGSRVFYREILFGDITDNPISEKSSEFTGIVSGYKLKTDGYSISAAVAGWYLLEVRIDNKKTKDKRGNDIDTMHPGFFNPSIELLRNKKLNYLIKGST